MRIRSLHFKADLISPLILEKNVKNVDFPIQIYSIAPKSGEEVISLASKGHDAISDPSEHLVTRTIRGFSWVIK